MKINPNVEENCCSPNIRTIVRLILTKLDVNFMV